MKIALHSRAKSVLVAASLVVGAGLFATSAQAADTSVDVTSPADGSRVAGTSTVIEGTVGAKGSSGVDSVTYVIDLSSSTSWVRGMDCNGDGAKDAKDDLNGDKSVGDVLDCEIASVISLNKSLAAAYGTGIKVSMVAFGNTGAVVDLNGSTFVTPGAKDASGRNIVEHAARSLKMGEAKQYTSKYVGGGTSFNNALATTLASVPASNERYVFMMSDGQSYVSQTTLDKLKASGLKTRTFGVGSGANCESDLKKIAATTGESCTEVSDPTKLAAALTGKPTNVKTVTVTVSGPDGYSKSFDVTSGVTTLGGWKTPELTGLKAGQYTATAKATFTDGSEKSDKHTFTVGDASSTPPSSSAPSSSAPTSQAPTSSAPTTPKRPTLPDTGN